MGVTVTSYEAVWLKRILKEPVDVPIKDLILRYCDNMSSIHLARKPLFQARTKHIEVHYHLTESVFWSGMSICNTSI